MNPRKRRIVPDDMMKIGSSLRDGPGDAPDLTGSILDRVAQHTPFVCARTCRWVRVTRISLGVLAAACVLAIALTHRYAPGSLDLVSRPAPLSSVVQSVATQASARFGTLRETLDSAADRVHAQGFITAVSAEALGGSGGGGGEGNSGLTSVSAGMVLNSALFVGPVLPGAWPGARPEQADDAWMPVSAGEDLEAFSGPR